jgi:rsbT co-antagonist protein RsbR
MKRSVFAPATRRVLGTVVIAGVAEPAKVAGTRAGWGPARLRDPRDKDEGESMDEKSAKRLASLLAEHRDEVLTSWATTVRATLRGRLAGPELSRQLEEIYGALHAALEGGATGSDDLAAAELRDVLNELSRSRARQGFSATETAISVFGLKDALVAVLPTKDTQVSADYADFSLMVDKLGLLTLETYLSARDAIIAEQSAQLLELSTPVVKLWEGVVAVPLVGTLDAARSELVMERLLQALVETSSPFAILDITGVPAVDTQVAQHLLKTVVAAQLMGTRCIISGIRPQIAQTIVSLGIEFGEIVTKANLADALQYALRESGLDVGRLAAPSLLGS